MSDPHDLPAVESLLAERDAIIGWLTRLEQRGSSAPEEVRDRVRRDYQGRLDGLTERLREHAETVGNRLRADQAEHDGLMAQARAARAELAEVELRHAVGEYDAERFESERRRHVATLDTLEVSLAEVGERIARLEEVHDLVTAPAGISGSEPEAAEPEPAAAAEAEPIVGRDVEDAVEEAVADLADEEPEATSEPEPSIIELAPADEPDTDDLLSIFDPAAHRDGPIFVEDDEPARHEPPPPPAAPEIGPLSFTPRGGGEPGTPAHPAVPPSAPPLGMPGAEHSPRFVRPGQRGGSEVAEQAPIRRPEAVRVIPDPEPVLPDVPVDTGHEVVARTLRCSECGAMNRPLEWYCEKCGAELTAV